MNNNAKETPEWLKEIYAETDKRIEESLAKSRIEHNKDIKEIREIQKEV
jgi:hypothetical protein